MEINGSGLDEAHEAVESWIGADPEHHRVNLLIAGAAGAASAFVLARDVRRSHAPGKGLMGGFEAAGVFAYSEPLCREGFEGACLETARELLVSIRPDAPAWSK